MSTIPYRDVPVGAFFRFPGVDCQFQKMQFAALAVDDCKLLLVRDDAPCVVETRETEEE